MKRGLFFIGLMSSGILLVQCTKDKTEPIVTPPLDSATCIDTVSFNNEILPLIVQNCSASGCHGGSSSAGGYSLENYANISTNASQITSVIKHEQGVTAMPAGAPKLADSLIQKFECWVVQGKLDN